MKSGTRRPARSKVAVKRRIAHIDRWKRVFARLTTSSALAASGKHAFNGSFRTSAFQPRLSVPYATTRWNFRTTAPAWSATWECGGARAVWRGNLSGIDLSCSSATLRCKCLCVASFSTFSKGTNQSSPIVKWLRIWVTGLAARSASRAFRGTMRWRGRESLATQSAQLRWRSLVGSSEK